MMPSTTKICGRSSQKSSPTRCGVGRTFSQRTRSATFALRRPAARRPPKAPERPGPHERNCEEDGDEQDKAEGTTEGAYDTDAEREFCAGVEAGQEEYNAGNDCNRAQSQYDEFNRLARKDEPPPSKMPRRIRTPTNCPKLVMKALPIVTAPKPTQSWQTITSVSRRLGPDEQARRTMESQTEPIRFKIRLLGTSTRM